MPGRYSGGNPSNNHPNCLEFAIRLHATVLPVLIRPTILRAQNTKAPNPKKPRRCKPYDAQCPEIWEPQNLEALTIRSYLKESNNTEC